MSEFKGNPQKERVAEAIAQVLAGDVNAYEIIHECCNDRLRAFVGARFSHRGPDFVDEVVARAHAQAFLRLGRFDRGRGSFMTWLCWQARQMAKQVAVEWYGVDLRPFDDDVNVPVMATVPDPADMLRVAESGRLLWREYRALAAEGRLSIALHDLEERTFAVTARHMSMTVAKVRRMRDGALWELRRRLRRLGVGARSCSIPEPSWSGRDDTGGEDGWSATAVVMEPGGFDAYRGTATELMPVEEEM